jgi:hypothetical protein
MCGRPVPEGEDLCGTCRNALEWRQRQQAAAQQEEGATQRLTPEELNRPSASQQRANEGAGGAPSPVRGRAPQTSGAGRGKVAGGNGGNAAAGNPAKAKTKASPLSLLLGLALAAFLVLFVVALLFGSSGSRSSGKNSLETWAGAETATADAGEDTLRIYAADADTVRGQNTPVTTPATGEDSEYVLPGSDSEYIDEAVIASLSAEELRLARNEIYARHGRIFQDETLAAYFGSKSWYVPLYEASAFDALGDSILNEYEIANRDLIVAYEQLRNSQ